MKLLIQAAEGEQFYDLIDEVEGFDVVRVPQGEDASGELADADVLFGWPSAESLAAAKQLKWVQAPSAGVDFMMKIPELVESDILVTNTRGAHAVSIAEHTFGLLLSLTRVVPRCLEWQEQKYWAREEGYRIPREIKDSTMGIIGYGQIGRAIARRAHGFEMGILAVDARPGAGDDYVSDVWGLDRLNDMLSASDVVAVAAPYTRESHHMLSDDALGAMKDDAYLIVVSRGGILDEAALKRVLDEGKLAGVGLDVAENEPVPADNPIWEFPRTLISPHLAGSSWQKERRVVGILVENMGRFQRGEELLNLVDKRAGY